MKRDDQLQEEQVYPNLAEFVRSGGRLEVGEDLSDGGLVRIRKHNKTVVVHGNYRDFASILKEMDSKAREYMEQESKGD